MKKLNAKIVIALSCASFLVTCAHAQDAKTTNPPARTESPKTNAAPSTARNIRFQFEGIPYSDVLERFAQMSGKPLLATTNIQGTLTYNDPKPYSYGEALDILNLMLSMKDMMLVDSGSHLQLVPFKQLPQMPLKIIRGADATGDVRPGEVVTVVLDLKSLDAKEVADSLVPMLSNAGSVAPLSRGRGLILTDRLQNIQRIKYLLAQIDTESTAQRQMKTFTLLHSSGAVVADLINRTFGIATAPKRTAYNSNSKQLDVLPPDPSDYVTAVFDDASRTLVLFGPRERIGLAEDLISRFEDKEGPQAGDVRIYFPQTIRADELATMIRQAIPGVAAPNETGTAAALKARLIADASQNRLIVSAPVAGQLDDIERLINKVDKPIHGTGQFSTTRSQTVHITKVFRPRSAEPAAVAKILSEALSRRSTTGVILPIANVSVEPGSQTVVVTGSPADVQTAIDIITQLETGSTMPVPQQTKFIDVGTVAEAKRLLPLVEQIYRSQVTDSLSGQVAHARIIADAEAGRLIVTASDDHLKRIQSIVDQLRTNQPKREMAVLPVQSKSASELIAVVSQLMAQLGEDQANPQLAAKLIPDTSGKQIIALATAKDLERIRGLVQQLDTATAVAAARQFKGVDLFSRTAAELAPLVQQLYSEQLKGSPEPAGGPATLIADAKNNRVMVSGSEKEIARVEAIIRQLDPAEKRAAKEETRVIRLKTGSATELAGLVEKSVNAQAQQVRVLVDARSNSLVVNGESGAVEAAAQIISQLDTRSDMGPREMRIIDLRSGDAGTLAPMVITLFTDMTRDQRGPDYVAQTKIVPDTASNRLIVTGSRDEINQISKLVQQLDQTPEQSGSARVFKLQMASATTLAPIVSNAMVRFDARGQALRKVTVSADDKSNSLIVTGGRADVQDAAVIISRLDGDSEGTFQEEARELKIIPVNTTNPDQLAALALRVFAAQNLGRNITNILSITPEPSGKRLIVLAPRTLLPQVEQVVSSLDQTRPTREAKVFDVGRLADAQRLLPLAQQLYRDQFGANAAGEAQFVSDGKTGRIIVSARADHLNSIDEMFARLRTTSPTNQAARETRSFDIGTAADVQRVLPLVQQLYQDQWRDKLETDPADAQIVGDARSGRIIVSGKPEHIKQIEAIIAQLGTSKTKPVTEARDTRVYELTTANAMDLATTVRTLYTEQAKLRLGTLQPDTLILPDASANRLIISGETSELTAIEEIIQKLDKVSGQSASTRVFKLNTAAPAQVASLLSTALIKTDAYGRQLPRVSVGADERNSMLVVSGEPKDLQAAAVIIEQMDSATAQEQRQMRIIPLKSGLATDVSTKLRQIYTDQLKGQGKGGIPDALILGDDTSSRLIITASESHLKLLDDLIKQLEETGEGATRQLRVISLQQQSASSVAAMISQLFSRQTRDPSQRLTVTASPDDRTLVVDAAGRTFEEVEQLVKSLDKAMGDTQNVVQTVQLKKAQAEGLADAVNKSIVSRGLQGRLQKVSVTGVQGANSLLINGPSDAVQEVMKIVRELDTESEDGEIKVRIYKLENGNVREVQGVINQVLQGVTVAERRRTGRGFANLSTDERSNSLIISGSEAHFKVIEQLLKTLDRTPERSDRDVQFVFLKNTRAVDVGTKLEGVFAERPQAERPVIEADTFGNSITIIGRRSDVIQAQDLIARLDETSKDNSIQVRLRPIDRLPAEQMARMLQNIYPQMSSGRLKVVEKIPQPPKTSATATNAATPNPNLNPTPTPPATATNQQEALPSEVIIAVDKDANALILSGPANELDQIDRIISELSFSFISNDAEFRLVALKEADPIVVARAINQLFRIEEPAPPPQQQQQQQQQQRPAREPRITVVAEPRTRSVIVRAKPADFSLVENLIKQLDASQISAQLEFRTVPVTNATPAKVLPLVEQMVTQLRLARPGDPLSVAVDSRSSGILIVARGPVMEQVEKMIRSLDTPSVYSEAEVLVVALKKANATQLAGILQNMLKPSPQGEWTAEARELQEQIRRLKIQGDDGQTVSLDLTKPIKIMSDPVAGAQGGNRLVLTSTSDNLKALAAVIAMMDNVAISEGVDVKIVRLERADADAVAQTLSSIFSQGQRLATGPGGRAEPEGTGKALVNPLNVALDARNNAVILSGRKESLELAEKIINDLDRELERFITEVKLFKLKFASATRLLPLLQAVFAEGPAVPGSAGLQQQVTRLRTALDGTPARTTDQPKSRAALVMQADDSANVIIAAARADVLPLIEDVIKQLDIPAASGLSTVRLFPLKHAEPQLVQKIINDLYAGARANQVRNEDKPTVTIDDRTSTLIVASTERTFAIIESLLGNLDKELPLELRDVRILPLNHADAVELASQLQRLLDARVTQKTAVGKAQAEALRALIIGEPRSNSLLIGGSNDSFELVQTLATQLDKPPSAVSGKIRQLPLQYADARNVATALNSLFTQRYQSAKSPEVQRNKPIIVPDPRGNSLLIGAGMDDNQMIDELLLKLDKKLDDPNLQIGVLALKHNDSGRVATTLENLFTARLQSRTPPGEQPSAQDRVKIETDSLNNALIVSANRENLELIQSLLQKLDIEPSVLGGVVTTFTLQFADAQRVATILRTLVDQGLYRPGAIVTAGTTSGKAAGGRDALAISVDPRSNTLIVSASPENLAIVRTVIAQVDTKDFAESGNVRLYTLKNARASTLAPTLEQFFRARRQGESTSVNAPERMIPLTIVPDDRSNTLLVTGTKEGFDVIERLLLQLDGEDVRARMSFRVFPLKMATAAKLQETLRQLFANRPPRVKGEPSEPISVVADSWVNALIVGASIEDMSAVTSLIERLDSEQGGPGLAVQVFPLAKADARRIAQTVQSLYREGTGGTGSIGQPVTVSADERINAIVVSAGEADVKRIAELIKKLDTDQVARVAEIRVFPLRYARAETLASILNTSLNTKPAALSEQSPNAQSVLQFIARNSNGRELVTSALKEGVLITPDSRVNSLIVSAPVDYMGLLEQIITKLDNSSHQKAKIKVFALQNADARQTAEVLAGLFRLAQAAAPGQNSIQRSIQYTLVKTVAAGGNGGTLSESEIASAVLGTDEQSALNVTIDPRTNSLLIGGTEDYVSLVSEIIEALDSSEAQERKTEVYRLRNAQAQEVATAIRTFLDQERQRVTQVLGTEAVGTAQRLLEREIAVVAEPVSNTLLLSASPRYFDSIRSLIKELDTPQPQVLIQVLVAEVSLDNALDLGLEWTYNGVPFAAGIEVNEAKWIESGFSSAVTGGDYAFLFRALEDKGRLEVLSRPQIVTADNKPAAINIGQNIPLITDSRVTERGDTINSFKYENVGVNLSVTPRIAPDGFVKMDVYTTNSTISSSTVKVNANAEVPIINQRIANTTVSVQSGQSILIGGLIGTLDDKRVRKVPFLGDIPVLGYLFRSNRNRQERRELLILLTPQVLTKSELAAKMLDPRDMTDEQLRKSRIKDEIKRDEVQKQILDPIFPPDQKFQPKGAPEPKPGDLKPNPR